MISIISCKDYLTVIEKARDRAFAVALQRRLFHRFGVARANAHADRLHKAFMRRYDLATSPTSRQSRE